MIDNNYNDDSNYILYKKIFNNIYLSNLIFNKLKERPKYSRNFVYKYNEIPFSIIFKYQLEAIFYDKVQKQGLKIKSFETRETLLKNFKEFLKKLSSSTLIKDPVLLKFYLLNKQYLVNGIREDSSATILKRFNGIDLFSIFLELKNFEILKIVYNDEKENIETERQYYIKWNLERNKLYFERYGVNLDLEPDFTCYNIEVSSPFSIHFNNQLIKQAIESSPENDITTIEFLNEIGLDLAYYNTHLYYWGLLQPDRIGIVNYLLDTLKVPVPRNYFNNFHYFTFFFDNLLLLDYSTFKRLIKQGSPVLLKDKSVLYRDIINYKHGRGISNFQQQLNFMMIGIYSYYIDSNNYQIRLIVKIIKQLLKPKYQYLNNTNGSNINNNDNSNKFTSKTIKELIISMNNKIESHNSKIRLLNKENNTDKNNNNYSVFGSIKKLFKFIKSNESELGLKDNSQLLNLLKIFEQTSFSSNYFSINYENFDLEREIKRIYIFQFMTKIISDNEKNILHETIFKFASKYQEYHLLLNYSLFINSSKIVKELLYSVIVSNLDIKLYEYCINNKILNNQDTFVIATENKEMLNQLDEYITLLESFKRNYDPFFKILLISILQVPLSNDTIDLLMKHLNEYYTLNQISKDNYIYSIEFPDNCSNNFYYITTNYNQLFIKYRFFSSLQSE